MKIKMNEVGFFSVLWLVYLLTYCITQIGTNREINTETYSIWDMIVVMLFIIILFVLGYFSKISFKDK